MFALFYWDEVPAFMTSSKATTEPERKKAPKSEFRRMTDLAAPIVLTQLAWVAMLTTDTAMIGRLGADALAGASLSLMVFFLTWVFCFGVVTATAALASQAYGARDPRTVRRVIRQGLWVALLITTPALALFQLTPALLIWTGQPAETLPHADAYMSTLMWCLAPSIGFTVIRNFVSAVNRPGPALWVMLAGVPLNAFLDYALIFGNFGLPRLELVGAGIATSLVNWLMFLCLLATAVWCKPFSKYAVLGRFWRPDWFQFRRIFQNRVADRRYEPARSGILHRRDIHRRAIRCDRNRRNHDRAADAAHHLYDPNGAGSGGDGSGGPGSRTPECGRRIQGRMVRAGAHPGIYECHDRGRVRDTANICIDISGCNATRQRGGADACGVLLAVRRLFPGGGRDPSGRSGSITGSQRHGHTDVHRRLQLLGRRPVYGIDPRLLGRIRSGGVVDGLRGGAGLRGGSPDRAVPLSREALFPAGRPAQ